MFRARLCFNISKLILGNISYWSISNPAQTAIKIIRFRKSSQSRMISTLVEIADYLNLPAGIDRGPEQYGFERGVIHYTVAGESRQ